jgi:peptide/nickel transport system permease protein
MDQQAIEHTRTSAIAEAEEQAIFVASNWQLVWWRFRKHRAAVISAFVLAFFYLLAGFCELIAPYDPDAKFLKYKMAPPTRIHLRDADGNWCRPFVYRMLKTEDERTLRPIYTEEKSTRYPIRLLVSGDHKYRLWGLFPSRLKLFGLGVPQKEQGIFLFGTDHMGRDVFSRLCYGARLSLSIGLVGVAISMILGILLGGLSGYYGGAVDNLIQRLIEFIRSIPSIPLWMGLSAALPPGWPIVRVYFSITLILSLIGWTGLARVVRGRFLSLREEDFITAARLAGASELRIIFRHMLPSFLSHIIASMTLSIPGMILGETALSFLGLGLRPPAISWGVLLQDAQNLRAVVVAPWMMVAPATCVVIAVLAFNFVGDGLRDAADPYAR